MIDNCKIKIEKKIYKEIIYHFENKRPEQGGIIGCSAEGVISEFHYDQNPEHSDISSYVPNTEMLNEIINGKWLKKEVSFIGFVHSHYINGELSLEDVEYARKILSCFCHYKFIIMAVCEMDINYKISNVLWYGISDKDCVSLNVIIKNNDLI